MAMVKVDGVAEVTDADFEGEVLKAELPVLVEFGAQWCGPCRQLAPVLGEISREEEDRLKIVQMDVDHNPRTAIAYGILSVPSLVVFRGGEPVRSMVGARPKRRLLAELAEAEVL